MIEIDRAALDQVNALSAHLGHRRKAAKPGITVSKAPRKPKCRVQTEMHWDRGRHLRPGLEPDLTPILGLYREPVAPKTETYSGQGELF